MLQKPFCSLLVPAKNEAANLFQTLTRLSEALTKEEIPHEILVVNDVNAEGDPATRKVIAEVASRHPSVRLIENLPGNHGLGKAISVGLEQYKGDCVAIVMADGSDDPKDVVRYYAGIQEGYDCVFGTRFAPGSRVLGYPRLKLLINRLANWFLASLFFIRYQDFTNAFKMYSRKSIDGIKPLLSPHFGITVEMPLKAIIRGYTWKVIPNHWFGKKTDVSNLRIARMASRYLYIALVLFLERLLVSSDYARKDLVKGAPCHAS